MSSHEWAEWVAYARVEPFGEARANWHMAVLAELLYNSNRPQDAQPLDAANFMWKIPPTKQQQAREQRGKDKTMWQNLLGWARRNQAIEKAKHDYTG